MDIDVYFKAFFLIFIYVNVHSCAELWGLSHFYFYLFKGSQLWEMVGGGSQQQGEQTII